jgi:hypothetical protein
MLQILLIDVVLCAVLIAVAAPVAVLRWRRGGGQLSMLVRHQRRAVAELSGEGSAVHGTALVPGFGDEPAARDADRHAPTEPGTAAERHPPGQRRADPPHAQTAAVVPRADAAQRGAAARIQEPLRTAEPPQAGLRHAVAPPQPAQRRQPAERLASATPEHSARPQQDAKPGQVASQGHAATLERGAERGAQREQAARARASQAATGGPGAVAPGPAEPRVMAPQDGSRDPIADYYAEADRPIAEYLAARGWAEPTARGTG